MYDVPNNFAGDYLLPDSIKCWAQIIISIVEYYLVFVMVLNMLILIKRFKALIDNG